MACFMHAVFLGGSMIETKQAWISMIPNYCAILVIGCAQSHHHEGYQPTTAKELAAAQEKTQINSLDRTLEAAERRSQTSGGESGSAVATSEADIDFEAY